MPRKLKIELELDDHGMAKNLKVNGEAVVSLGDDIDKTKKKAKSFGDITSVAFGNLAARGISSALSGIRNLARNGFRLLNDSVKLAGIQQIAEGKLKTALKNMGDESEASFLKLKRAASALQDVSNFGDEMTLTAQAMLLTFREVSGAEGAEVLTRRMADVAAGLTKVSGEAVDLNNVAALMGKSLSRSASELSRVGVSFSKVQEEAFNAAEGMDKVNILAEILDDNFKGMAESLRDPLKQLSNDVGDLKEELGFQLRPEINAMAEEMRSFVKDPQTVGFVKEIGQAVIATVGAAGKVFEFVGGISRGIRASIRLTIGKWREFQLAIVNGTLKITQVLQSSAEFLGMGGMAGSLAELNKELVIQSLALKVMADGEKALAAEIMIGNQALEKRQELTGGGAGGSFGGGSTTGAGSGAAGASQDTTDPLATMKKRREELIMQGQITQELIGLNAQIAAIEAERAFTREASQITALEGAEAEKSATQEQMDLLLQKKDAEIEAAAATIAATKEVQRSKAELAKQEQQNLARQVQANTASALSSGSAADAIKNSIRGIIQAKLAQLIASILAPLGPAALVVGPLLAAGGKALFQSLVPGFASGGTVQGPPGTDNVLARLTPGEEVINAKASAENRPLIRAINSGLPASAGMGPMSIDVNINGQLTANNDQILAQLDETEVAVQQTRGQIRTERPS